MFFMCGNQGMITLAYGHMAAHRTELGTSLFTALWQPGAESKDTRLASPAMPDPARCQTGTLTT